MTSKFIVSIKLLYNFVAADFSYQQHGGRCDSKAWTNLATRYSNPRMQSRCSSTAGHQHVFSWNWKKAFVVYVIWKFSAVSDSVHACFGQCWTLLHRSATLRLPLITIGQRSEQCGHLAAMQLQLTVPLPLRHLSAEECGHVALPF